MPHFHQWTDHPDRKSVRKQFLYDSLDQLDLIDIFRAFHPKAAEYTFFSSARGMFSRLDHMLGHNTSLKKFKRMDIGFWTPISVPLITAPSCFLSAFVKS